MVGLHLKGLPLPRATPCSPPLPPGIAPRALSSSARCWGGWVPARGVNSGSTPPGSGMERSGAGFPKRGVSSALAPLSLCSFQRVALGVLAIYSLLGAGRQTCVEGRVVLVFFFLSPPILKARLALPEVGVPTHWQIRFVDPGIGTKRANPPHLLPSPCPGTVWH